MECTLISTIYNKDDYIVAKYFVPDGIVTPDNETVIEVICTGYAIPLIPKLKYIFNGEWVKNAKFGWQLAVKTYEVIRPTSTEKIEEYLAKLVKGIGPVLAKKITTEFGDNTLTVLETEPEKLLKIKGITENKLDKIISSYIETQGANKLIMLLAPYNISNKHIIAFYRKYGASTMEIIENNPYSLTKIKGISFYTADKIALDRKFAGNCEERISAGIMYCLEAIQYGDKKLFKLSGHTTLPLNALKVYVFKLLNLKQTALNINNLNTQIQALHQKNKIMLCVDKDGTEHIYKYAAGVSEKGIAESIFSLMADSSNNYVGTDQELLDEIANEEDIRGARLSPEQKKAIITCLKNPVTVITGGPGTGKTMIQQFVLSIFQRLGKKQNVNKTVTLCAPTGKAASRMNESTENKFGATTCHKALGLYSTENEIDDKYNTETTLNSDIIIIDEISMLDVYLAYSLMYAIAPGSKVLFVGDVDQLPSIGAGSVLKDLIDSETIPVVRLCKVYRQESASKIAINAALIREGVMNLEYAPDFEFVDTDSFEKAAHEIVEIFVKKVKEVGVENVVILSPFKVKTETGVNHINQLLQNIVNPAKGELEFVVSKKDNRCFRIGDRVMQTKNKGLVSNGDVGVVSNVYLDEDNTMTLQADFGEGRFLTYHKEEISELSLAYATTIHKSQGSEYNTVIMSIMNEHSIMLKRNLIYTGITRAKKQIVIVGHKKAICKAIYDTDIGKRQTLLKKWLQNEIQIKKSNVA